MAKAVCRPTDFLPVFLKLTSSGLDIATQLSQTNAPLVKTIESFTSPVTHDEGGDSPIKVDRDDGGSAAGMHNACKLYAFFTLF